MKQEQTKEDKLKKYPKTEKFEVIDTIGVPHPYCITPKHVAWASDHHFGILDRHAIEEAEKNGATCDICKKIAKKNPSYRILSISEHKQALLIEVNDTRKLNEVEGIKEYLLQIKEMCVADGFSGFAFKQRHI
jgi:hypothetical protein